MNPSDTSDLEPVKPEVCLKSTRISYFGPTSTMAALTQDHFLKGCFSKIYEAKKAAAQSHKKPFKFKKSIRPIIGSRRDDPISLHPFESNYVASTAESLDTLTLLTTWNPDILLGCRTDFKYQFPRPQDRRICDFLVSKFMRSINLLFPTVNPIIFRSDMAAFWDIKHALLDSNDKDPSDRHDLRGLSLFIMIIRLGRLCLPVDWKPSHDGFDDAYIPLLGNKLFDFALCSLRQTNYMSKPNLTIIQILLLMRINMIITPEDGDGGDGTDSSVFSGMLSQMGTCMGLHRDPNFFPKVPPLMAESWRQIWRQIMIMDTYRSLELSIPFSISLEMSDTQLQGSNTFGDDVEPEEKPSSQFQNIHVKWALLARKILAKVMKSKYTISAAEFEYFSHELENFEEEHLHSFQLLISVLQEDSTVCGQEDSYNLIQKFILQLLFLRLHLILLRSYFPPASDVAKHRILRLQTSLKLVDTITKCVANRLMFSGFEWILVPLSLRYHGYPLTVITNSLFRLCYYSSEHRSSAPPDLENMCDLSFRYDEDTIATPLRLWQCLLNVRKWVETFSSVYYGAWKSNSVLYAITKFIHSELWGQSLNISQNNSSLRYTSSGLSNSSLSQQVSNSGVNAASSVNSINNLLGSPQQESADDFSVEGTPNVAYENGFNNLWPQPNNGPSISLFAGSEAELLNKMIFNGDVSDLDDWMNSYDVLAGFEANDSIQGSVNGNWKYYWG